MHAEAAAIRDAVRKGVSLKGATIYVARDSALMSRPCSSCLKLIKKYGIEKIVYTAGDGSIETEWPPPVALELSAKNEPKPARNNSKTST